MVFLLLANVGTALLAMYVVHVIARRNRNAQLRAVAAVEGVPAK